MAHSLSRGLWVSINVHLYSKDFRFDNLFKPFYIILILLLNTDISHQISTTTKLLDARMP